MKYKFKECLLGRHMHVLRTLETGLIPRRELLQVQGSRTWEMSMNT